ncbi:MAG: sce7726 family protein [Acidimicrobiales bacterium]|jgi:hypothetical protein
MASRLRDCDIRLALDTYLRQAHGAEQDTLIRHELGLCAGTRRVDLAVLNGEIAGYEIKSDEDTLKRLAGQADVYGRVLDRAVIVTTQRHVESAKAELPQWWGVTVATHEHGAVNLRTKRKGRRNTAQQTFAVAQLLWRDEALIELRERGLGRGLSREPRHYVWLALSEALALPELRAVVLARLKARSEWPGGQ